MGSMGVIAHGPPIVTLVERNFKITFLIGNLPKKKVQFSIGTTAKI
jgi:hypothetical protein